MPTNVFANSLNNSEKKIVQKPYLRTNDLESNLEEDTDVKSQ